MIEGHKKTVKVFFLDTRAKIDLERGGVSVSSILEKVAKIYIEKNDLPFQYDLAELKIKDLEYDKSLMGKLIIFFLDFLGTATIMSYLIKLLALDSPWLFAGVMASLFFLGLWDLVLVIFLGLLAWLLFLLPILFSQKSLEKISKREASDVSIFFTSSFSSCNGFVFQLGTNGNGAMVVRTKLFEFLESGLNLARTIAHEQAHLYGLTHVSDKNSIMHPYADPVNLTLKFDEVSRNKLLEILKPAQR